MQVVDVVRQVLFERVGQRRLQPGAAFDRDVHGCGQYLGARDEHDDLTVADVRRSLPERPGHRRAPPCAAGIYGDPVRSFAAAFADPDYEVFRHSQIVPRLRMMGVTSPRGPRIKTL